jgi:hypothetical protein
VATCQISRLEVKPAGVARQEGALKSISMLIGRIDGPRRMGLRTQRLSDPFGFVSGNGSPVTKASPTSHRLLNCRLVCGPSGEHRRHTGQPSGFLKRQHLQFSTRESRAAGALRTPRVLTAQACSARNEQTISTPFVVCEWANRSHGAGGQIAFLKTGRAPRRFTTRTLLLLLSLHECMLEQNR